MASARDLITIFVALELLSIPAYLLAGWRKRDLQGQRGRPEVLPDGRVRLRRDALRHVAALRRDRVRRCSPRSAVSIGEAATQHARSSPSASCSSLDRLRLQGVGRAVPHLGARHLRGCADARSPRSWPWPPRPPASWPCCILVFVGFQGRDDVCRAASCRRAGRRHDDRRQPHRPAPDQRRAHARLLGHRPGRLHAGALAGRPPASPRDRAHRRSSSTWSSTRP